MLYRTGEIPHRLLYRLLIGSIVPRPIAWLSTVGKDGTRNLAPFSYFMGVCSDPPTLAVSINKGSGERKDSLRNIQETGDFVVNVVGEPLFDAMNATSPEYPYEVDEFAVAGLTAVPSVTVTAPRVLEAPISLECRLVQITQLGAVPRHTSVVFGEVVAWHFDDAILTPDGVPDMGKLLPVGRMIGDEYLFTRERRSVARPTV